MTGGILVAVPREGGEGMHRPLLVLAFGLFVAYLRWSWRPGWGIASNMFGFGYNFYCEYCWGRYYGGRFYVSCVLFMSQPHVVPHFSIRSNFLAIVHQLFVQLLFNNKYLRLLSIKPLWHLMIATSVIMYSQNYIFNKGK